MANYYCKNCGDKFSSISSLTSSDCRSHPNGRYKGKHTVFEGKESSQYQCKNCGDKFSSISSLTSSDCRSHPDGRYKGKHIVYEGS